MAGEGPWAGWWCGTGPRRRPGTARAPGPSTRSCPPRPAPSSTAQPPQASRSATPSAASSVDSAGSLRMPDRPPRGGERRGLRRKVGRSRWRSPCSQIAWNEEITEDFGGFIGTDRQKMAAWVSFSSRRATSPWHAGVLLPRPRIQSLGRRGGGSHDASLDRRSARSVQVHCTVILRNLRKIGDFGGKQ